MKYKFAIASYLVLMVVIWSIALFSGDGKAAFLVPEPKRDMETIENTQNVSEAAVQVNMDINRPASSKPSYMVYYGVLTDDVIELAKQYDVFIMHPRQADATRAQVQEIRAAGTCVLGYISIGEDLRTAGMTAEEMLADARFTGDGTGPRTDPRPSGQTDLDGIDPMGEESSAGTGYASYYLDDNDYDGAPDFNINFKCAFTNIGDPAWYDVLDEMTLDGEDRVAGIREILSHDYGRSLGCDGLFLDTIDTCAPNQFTEDDSPGRTRFEWTAGGVAVFLERLREEYPEHLVCQNRGLFFYNPYLPHYQCTPRKNVDFVMFESYMLDSNQNILYYDTYHADNKYNYAPKLIAEAARPDGFQVLSLGYAEGPEEFKLRDTLLGNSEVGMDILMEDLSEAQNEAGFSHYITDGSVTLANDFVLTHEETGDESPPVWSSVCNDPEIWPPTAPKSRVGIGQTEPAAGGMIVRWDVATDKNDVSYTLYYQKEPFDFKADPDLETARSITLVPQVGEGYETDIASGAYPYQAYVRGLDRGEKYYFVIRAKDTNGNEEKNTVVLEDTPL